MNPLVPAAPATQHMGNPLNPLSPDGPKARRRCSAYKCRCTRRAWASRRGTASQSRCTRRTFKWPVAKRRCMRRHWGRRRGTASTCRCTRRSHQCPWARRSGPASKCRCAGLGPRLGVPMPLHEVSPPVALRLVADARRTNAAARSESYNGLEAHRRGSASERRGLASECRCTRRPWARRPAGPRAATAAPSCRRRPAHMPSIWLPHLRR